jgi:hypothetical protein
MAQSPVGKAAGSKAAGSKAKRADTVGEISIVGSTELPNVTFSLPWQLPSVESRDGQKPPREIAGMFAPLDPKWHRQQIHFNRYLDVDLPSYQVK